MVSPNDNGIPERVDLGASVVHVRSKPGIEGGGRVLVPVIKGIRLDSMYVCVHVRSGFT